jgi:starch synthase (maltosyl-transferring)
LVQVAHRIAAACHVSAVYHEEGMPAPTIFHLGALAGATPITASRIKEIDALGFSALMVSLPDLACEPPSPALVERVGRLAALCHGGELALLVELDPFSLDPSHPLVGAQPELFALRPSSAGRIVDPRQPVWLEGRAQLRTEQQLETVIRFWSAVVEVLRRAGCAGFCLRQSGALGPALCASLIADAGPVLWIADATAQDWERMLQLKGCGFDYVLGSLPWWDYRQSWFVEEHALLNRIAPVMSQVGSWHKMSPARTRARCTRLALAACTGAGLVLPAAFARAGESEEEQTQLTACMRAANHHASQRSATTFTLSQRSGPSAALTILLSTGAADDFVVLINPDPLLATEIDSALLGTLCEHQELLPVAPFAGDGSRLLRPGEARLCQARKLPAVRVRQGLDVHQALKLPRVTIRAVTPEIAPGLALKRIVGERVTVEADIFTDGHPVISADLIHRAEDERSWQRVAMQSVGNDRWRAQFPLRRLGRHRFAIEAWIDGYASFVRDLEKKRDAGVLLDLEVQEGRRLIAAAQETRSGAEAETLRACCRAFAAEPPAAHLALLLAPRTIEAMRCCQKRQHLARSAPVLVDAERRQARFASWYELFPRSVTTDKRRHGSLRAVIGELPRIQAMGFDVLYLPPIHPIGQTNRKGANNAVNAKPGEPGSPYAIGSAQGGHDALHPELGSFEDFQALIAACHAHGLELALDFAIQCSPDHPWLKEHPGWFDYRPDGSIKYAENPPKKYEDIVNLDFYKPDACPSLWLTLRDVVEFWITQGVKIFRVDNPHTKPFAFWRWLIADIRGRHPEVIFLAEAFTRPKLMYELARLGFSQSYTYFTWRNSKQELTEYLNELATPPESDWLRPHFFVNTPDINPYFLQASGRAGFLLRAVLAATLSGLWGMYSGFELCEAAALPGREEYLDAEKYEIRPRDYTMPGNIVAEIAQLNRLRKAEPALQSHLGLTFYNAFNDQVLYYGKHAPGERARLLIAVSLDPRQAQDAWFEVPLWEWGLGDDGAVEARELISGELTFWHGKMQRLWLGTERPYAIWRVTPARKA